MTRAVDGDTIEISPAIDGIEDVRLIGMDTPETSSNCGTQPFANEAEQYTLQYTGGDVALEFDEERTDQYGRLLAYVYVPGGDMLNQNLTRRGLAQVATFPPNVKYETVFLDAQSEAQAESLGIWSLSYQQQLLLEDRGNGIGGGCEAQPEPTTPAPEPVPEPTPEPAPQPAPEPEAPAVPSGGDVDCSDFSSEAEATPYLLPGDPHRLDGDGDGRACED
jgi:micrococcal nuclease